MVEPDSDRCSALSQELGVPGYPDMDTMLTNAELRRTLDGVVICTPPYVRITLVEKALEAGLAVLVEKPLAHTVADARMLVRLAEQHPQVPTAVAFCHRFTPAIREMKRQIEQGEIGQLIRYENVFACWHPTMQNHWMSDPTLSGGGSLVDTGCHGIDIFHYLIGPSQFDAAIMNHQWAGRGDSNATMLIHHNQPGKESTPVAGVLCTGWAEPVRFIVTVVGTEALLSYDYEKPEQLQLLKNDGQSKTLRVETHETRFQHQLEAFADLIKNPQAETDLASFEDGLAAVQTLQSAQQQVVGLK
ncbi:MAG: hypothetical protein Kow00105_16080 [Phycisphaeraceae bacterium]